MAGILDSVKELAWPEVTGDAGAIAGHWLFRGIDNRLEWVKPFRRTQDYAAIGLGGAGAWMNTQTGYVKQIGRSLFHGNVVLTGEAGAERFFGLPEDWKIFKPKARKPMSPRARGNLGAHGREQLPSGRQREQQPEARSAQPALEF